MAHHDRVRRLLELQGSDAVERALLDGDALAYEAHQTATSGINRTFYVELEPDLVAFQEPHEGIVPRIARDYGHSLDTPPICECALPGNSPSGSVTHTTDSSRSRCTGGSDRLTRIRSRGPTVRSRFDTKGPR
jgi:hypothetical protein